MRSKKSFCLRRDIFLQRSGYRRLLGALTAHFHRLLIRFGSKERFVAMSDLLHINLHKRQAFGQGN